jgi:hypothetical protein
MSTFHYGFLVSSRCQIGSYKKDFFFDDLLKTYVGFHFVT